MLFDRFDELAPVAVQVLVQSVLQGVALTVLAGGMLRVFRRLSATARCTVWGFTLTLVIGLTGWNWFRPPASYSTWQLDSRWYVALACGWGAIAATRLGGLLRSYGATRRLVRGASAAGPKFAISSELAVPAVAGIVRPVILIPQGLAGRLSGQEMEHVLMHENAHIRRGDHWVNPALEVLCGAFFFHPAVWWIVRELRTERELACDDAVIQAIGEPVAYADCLAKLLEFSACAPSLAPVASGNTFRRVERLVENRPPFDRRTGYPALAALLAALLLGAMCGSRAPALIRFRLAPDRRAQQAAAVLARALEKERQADQRMRAANEQWQAVVLARQEAQQRLAAADRRLRTAREKLRLAELRNSPDPLKKS